MLHFLKKAKCQRVKCNIDHSTNWPLAEAVILLKNSISFQLFLCANIFSFFILSTGQIIVSMLTVKCIAKC